MDEQRRIPDAIVEELKTLALLRQPCTLQFRAANGGTASVHTRLTDVFEDEDGQYLVTENGFTLHLHQLLAINGKPLQAFC